jgi:alkanesulfonate monooxygenase SsuD/methylene tetrahydromethanopterin reductase-like flavin-dependent oxidoreductase (luciferase family)
MTPPDTTQTTGWRREGRSSVGAGVTPFQTDADATIRLAVRAERLGYARFGTAEGWTHDALVLLAQIAGVTSRIGLATTRLSVTGSAAGTPPRTVCGIRWRG